MVDRTLSARARRLAAVRHHYPDVLANYASILSSNASPRAEVLLRRGFVRRDTPLPYDVTDGAKGGRGPVENWTPLARMLAPRGVTLQTALVALFVAQCRAKPRNSRELPPVQASGPLSMANLLAPPARATPQGRYIGHVTDRVNRVRAVEAALNGLVAERIVERDSGRGLARKTSLMQEDSMRVGGPGLPWTMPKGRAVHVPVEFFTNGWVWVLDKSEIACFLMMLDAEQSIGTGAQFQIFGQERLKSYTLGKDTMAKHIELEILGLTKTTRPAGRRPDGSWADLGDDKPREHHTYAVLREGLGASAIDAVSALL